MDKQEALSNANEILDEEQRSPTISYSDSLVNTPGVVGAMAILFGPQYLDSLRLHRPREVLENPRRFVFRSTNYDLLVALLFRLAQGERLDFIHSVLLRLVSRPACSRARYPRFPSWNLLVSELPLLAEFAIRNGAAPQFFRILAEASPSPGHVILLRHLEDMIALNFTVLGKAQYNGQCKFSIENFARTTAQQLAEFKKQQKDDVNFPDLGPIGMAAAFREIIAAAEAILDECRKASYFYVKFSLSEGLNVEVNQDKNAVESYLNQLGFKKVLIDSLNEADRLYYGPANAFELKSSMGHLRSFIENLHAEAIPAITAKGGLAPTPGWGTTLTFLRQKGVLTSKEETLAAGLYGVISDQAIHPLIAEREYARLARNMVIEYGLLFLSKLEKLKLKNP